MKKLMFSLITILSTAVCFGGDVTNADFKKEKWIKKSYSFKGGNTLDIQNKYGDVVISNWEKDSVKFEIHVISYGDKLDRVMDKLEEIEIDFVHTGSYVSANTEWISASPWSKSLDEIRNSLNSSSRVEVNYRVFLPKKADLNLDNKFGDVFLPTIMGSLQADIAHGSFRADEITKIRHLKVKYGDARIKKSNTASIDISFGDLEIEEITEELILNSTGADVSIERVKHLTFYSKKDELRVESVGKMEGTATLSDIRVEGLENSIDINCKLGSLKLKNMETDFERINVDSYLTDITLITDNNVQSGISVTSENAKFSYDTSVKIESTNTLDKATVYNGKIGSNVKAQIIIHAKNGSISISA
jgi:hypothetical protein